MTRAQNTTPARSEALDEGEAGEAIGDFWQELLEKDDRSSPVDYPEMCLIRLDELADFIDRASLSPTPATLDEGAAGERDDHRYAVVSANFSRPFMAGAYPTFERAQLAQCGSPEKWLIYQRCAAHPSPTPAADDDRLRVAVEAIWEIAGGRAADGHNETGRLARIKDRAAEALAALKAEVKP